MNSFEALIEQHHAIIYKICRVYSGWEDFDDLYQEILINLWKSYKTFEGRSKLSTWLYRVALNTSLTFQRNTKKHKAKVPIDQVPIAQDSSESAKEKEQEIERLYTAISQLKKDDRSIILLYLEEKSYEEIGEIIGISVSNVGVRINRIKKKLLQLLSDQTESV